MLICIFIILLTLLLLFEIFWLLRRRRQLSKKDQYFILSEWRAIQEKLETHPIHALLEADKLLDFVLKKKGYSGSLAQKLQHAEKLFSHVDDVWTAHKLRNRLAHEVGTHAAPNTIRKAVSSIKQGLWNLGVKF